MSSTLLEIVQDILSSMDSFAVNSIDENDEARQVTTLVKRVYEDIVNQVDLPEHLDLFELNASGDNAKPTLMFKPSTVKRVEWLQYNVRRFTDDHDIYRDLEYMDPHDFIDRMNMLNTSADNVESFEHTIGADSITFMYKDDAPPSFYTVISDYTFVFDSYDAEVDTTLQKTKTRGYGVKVPAAFSISNSFVPDLDERQFALLFQEAKSLAFAELKQIRHDKAEKSISRLWMKVMAGYPNPPKTPNYGRK